MPHFDLARSYPTAESKFPSCAPQTLARKPVLLTGSNIAVKTAARDLVVACPTPFLTTSSLFNHFSCEANC